MTRLGPDELLATLEGVGGPIFTAGGAAGFGDAAVSSGCWGGVGDDWGGSVNDDGYGDGASHAATAEMMLATIMAGLAGKEVKAVQLKVAEAS